MTPPPAVFGTPPPVSASDFDCPTRCPARCHGTGAPSDSHLGGGQPDGGPDREAVNRPSRGRRGGRAVGELLQEDETIGRLVEPAGRAQEFTIAGGNRVSSRAISWRMSGSALVGPAGSAAPWPSPFWVQRFSTGAARSAASTPVPTATTCTANVRARSAAQSGAWATPHARSSLSVDWPASTYTNVAVRSSTAIGNLNAK